MQEVNYKEIVSWNKFLNKFSSLITDHYFSVCYTHAIGVARADTIPDSSFSALSNCSPGYVAKYGRLNGASSWASKDNSDANDYLQIDLLFANSRSSSISISPHFINFILLYCLEYRHVCLLNFHVERYSLKQCPNWYMPVGASSELGMVMLGLWLLLIKCRERKVWQFGIE